MHRSVDYSVFCNGIEKLNVEPLPSVCRMMIRLAAISEIGWEVIWFSYLFGIFHHSDQTPFEKYGGTPFEVFLRGRNVRFSAAAGQYGAGL